jgi:hypothetical protein
MRRELAALAAVLVVGACSGERSTPFALDGSPRAADDEGLVTAVDPTSITLDGARTYEVDDDIVSFSTIDLSAVPLLYTEGQYVQVGVKRKTVRWIGAVARPLTTKPPRVVFEGEVTRIDGADLVFSNGTVLAVGDGVETTGLEGARVQVGVRPDRHVVTEVKVR